MSRTKPDWAKTIVPWRIKEDIWRLWALGYTVSETSRYFDSHTDSHILGPFSRNTISKVRDELLRLPQELEEKLLKDMPEVKDLVMTRKPDLKGARWHKNSSMQGSPEVRSEQEPAVNEAKEMHFEHLFELVKAWQNEIGFRLPLPKQRFYVVFPIAFTIEDTSPVGYYEKGSLRWQLGYDGAVEVWFQIERQVLFRYLRFHLSNTRLWETFENLKQNISQALKDAASGDKDKMIIVRDATILAADMFDQLEMVLAKGTFTGKCPACSY